MSGFRLPLMALAAVMTLPLSACGHKGGLKSPSQIEAEQEKKAQKQAKDAVQSAPSGKAE